MQYLLMIYRSEAEFGKMDAAARKEMSVEYGAFTQSIVQSGHFKAGDALAADNDGNDRSRQGRQDAHHHGPFAETREALLGYYLIDAKNLDEALGIAGRVPSARIGSIEVRPIMVYE